MAAHALDLQMSRRHTPPIPIGVVAPFTPVHSPHHSVTSSASSRTPVHTLSIHEYRKQLKTPSLETATPVGKTLRRKAAAHALNGLEHVSPATSATRRGSNSALPPLHISQSAHQLHPRNPPSVFAVLPDQLLRSQSAELPSHSQGASISSESLVSGKVRHFNSRKRLPKPPSITTGGSGVCEPHVANARTASKQHLLALSSPLDPGTQSSRLSDTRTTPTVSTLSLSRFPQPPRFDHQIHLQNGVECTHINTANYATTAPVTPPATPATIHYRGASFDLVNPHDSLILHSIVTPSRDFGSSEYLGVPSPEELLVASPEMAPKRPLYGDLSAAHAGIMRRTEDPFSTSSLELPLPPTPAAISPRSSNYPSPVYSPESELAPSPLAVTKAASESRFSLKQLTRTLTRRLGNPKEQGHVHEMQNLHGSKISISAVSMDEDFSPSLEESHIATPEASYFPVSPASPISPMGFNGAPDYGFMNDSRVATELPKRNASDSSKTEPLTSMLPDELSTQIGRAEEGQLSSRPYYEDLDSIYLDSSVYTEDARRKSNYRQSNTGSRQSNPLLRYSGMETDGPANEYHQESLYSYLNRQSSRAPLEMFHPSVVQDDGKTDTISKIIDQYSPKTAADHLTSIMENHKTTDDNGSGASSLSEHATSRLSHFDFGLENEPYKHQKKGMFDSESAVQTRRSAIPRSIRSPPQGAAPLASPLGFDRIPSRLQEQSLLFSNRSTYSYGDTQNLLQISTRTDSAAVASGGYLEPSSSYSQPETNSPYADIAGPSSPRTPQAALDQAEEIFEDMKLKKQDTTENIPAIWARRSSGSLLINKKPDSQSNVHADLYRSSTIRKGAEEIDGDWESFADGSRGVRDSLSSYADYSSNDGSRNSQSFNQDGSLGHEANRDQSQSLSVYSHPSSVRPHLPAFNSSPPHFPSRGVRAANEIQSLPAAIAESSVPGGDEGGRPCVFAPWVDQYAFSDKETEELLASGPNDEIMFDNERQSDPLSDHHRQHEYDDQGLHTTSDGISALERENTFEKLCFIGPKGNLTGTPLGTGMHETGSSVADTSSPGIPMSSSIGPRSPGHYRFEESPLAHVRHNVRTNQSLANRENERPVSQVTLFPRASDFEPVLDKSPHNRASRRLSLRCSATSQRDQRRTSRTAVQGQTKLRHMILSPSNTRNTLSSQDTSFSRFMVENERPSTSHTNTPLRRNFNTNSSPTGHAISAHQHSPHLLCPERAPNAQDEERRRKLSWAILAVFCLLPPCILLYRLWGDWIIASMTNGHLGHCTPKSKKVALIAGIAVNIGIAVAIVVPVVLVHAFGAV